MNGSSSEQSDPTPDELLLLPEFEKPILRAEGLSLWYGDVRALNEINYQGPLSVEWEDSGMDREHGAAEACDFVRNVDFKPSERAFDAAFDE